MIYLQHDIRTLLGSGSRWQKGILVALGLVGLLAFATPARAAIPTPVSYWKFDESSGNAADAVGSNTLTNVGSASYSAGLINNAVSTVASSKYMENTSPTGLNPTTSFSINTWVKWSSLDTANWNGLVSKCDNSSRAYCSGIQWTGSGNIWTIGFDIGTGGSGGSYQETTNTTIVTGTWYMFTLVFNSATHTCSIYLNGTDLKDDTGCPSSAFAGTASFRVGYRNNPSPSDGSTGQFDATGFWNTTLSQADITALYNSGAGSQYPFTAAVKFIFWQFFDF